MKLSTRSTSAFLLAVVFAVALVGPGCSPAAPGYPTKDITYIVPYAQGGATDNVARALADATSPILGKPIVIKNVTGGSGTIGTAELAKSKPDGYTVLEILASAAVIQPHIQQVAYESPGSFEILQMVFSFPQLWVTRADGPYKSLQDVVDASKKNPGSVTYSNSGVGNVAHLGLERFSKMTGIKMKLVPYDNDQEGVVALLGGHVDTSICQPLDAVAHIREGRIRPLAALEEFAGMETLPGLKSFKQQGFDFEQKAWGMNVIPKGTPKEISDKLREAFKKGMENQTYKDYMAKTLTPINYKGPEEALALWKADYDAIAPIVKEVGLKK